MNRLSTETILLLSVILTELRKTEPAIPFPFMATASRGCPRIAYIMMR